MSCQPRFVTLGLPNTRTFRAEHRSRLNSISRKEDQKTVRFLLAWYAPVWKGAEKVREAILQEHYAGNAKVNGMVRAAAEQNYYTQKYADRYGNALDVAREVATNHGSLLKRVLAWQESIYSERSLPVWLRDSLVNNLALLTEDSLWVQARPHWMRGPLPPELLD